MSIDRHPISPALLASAAVFLGGFLLFTVELMVARSVLPLLGGSSLVWTTCVAFFQFTLLAGAGYGHFTNRLGPRKQALFHVVVLVVSFLLLPVGPPESRGTMSNGDPVWTLLGILAVTVGAQGFALSATSSLIQQWAARGDKSGVFAASKVYAASNIGSLVGLVAYPLLIEPAMGLVAQWSMWSLGYSAFVALSLIHVALIVGRSEERTTPAPAVTLLPTPRTQWFLLSFVPCCLLLGVTSHLNHEIPSFPLLWTVPLALYLISLIVPFSFRATSLLDACTSVEPILLAMLAVMMFVPVRLSGFSMHVVAVFVASLALHGRLALLAPESAHRGAYVLWMAAGGAAAGIFNAVVAPVVFPFVAEFPLAVVAACLLRPAPAPGRNDAQAKSRDIFFPLLLGALTLGVVAGLPHAGDERDVVARVAILFVAGGFAVISRRRRLRFGLSIGAVLAAGFWAFQVQGTQLMERSPYGVSRVVREPRTGRLLLFHGTTIHGAQVSSSPGKDGPQFYYRMDGPLGGILTSDPAAFGQMFGVVGLGAGSVAWYAQAGQRVRFFEIDPIVIAVAQQPRWFTFLSASRGGVDVIQGDGRVSLAREPNGFFDAIVLDAFSSDTIPTHMLTVEAMETYVRKLKSHGVLAFNTSNRHVDVAAVVAASARALDLAVLVTDPPAGANAAAEVGTWAVVARREGDLTAWTSGDSRWKQPPPGVTSAWTDDRASLLDVLRW